jgi:hypothetical protein
MRAQGLMKVEHIVYRKLTGSTADGGSLMWNAFSWPNPGDDGRHSFKPATSERGTLFLPAAGGRQRRVKNGFHAASVIAPQSLRVIRYPWEMGGEVARHAVSRHTASLPNPAWR